MRGGPATAGRDLATGAGVLGGGGGGGGTYPTHDVERCTTTPSQSTPECWDVSYRFRGVDHRVQMTHPPGGPITVNRHGEPRE